MKLLLDTHALLWASSSPQELSVEAREEIAKESNVVFVSHASLWELRIKESIGKIKLPKTFYRDLHPAGFELLPIHLNHIETFGKLPLHHRDPFDRMLIAQAQVDQLILVTRDETLAKYSIKIIGA